MQLPHISVCVPCVRKTGSTSIFSVFGLFLCFFNSFLRAFLKKIFDIVELDMANPNVRELIRVPFD